MSQRSVFCIASSRGRADHIVHALKEAEISKAEISALFLDRGAGGKRASGSAEPATAEAATAESAGEIRGVLRWIDGIGPLIVPDMERLIGAGPIATALRSANTRGVTSGLIDFGVPEAEAMRYETGIKEGHILISVHAENPDKSDRAREIFTAAGAEDIFTMVKVTTPKTSLLGSRGFSRAYVA